MRVIDLDKENIGKIEKLLYTRYSTICDSSNDTIYLSNPKITFNGKNMKIEDDLGTKIIVPGEYYISISSSSILMYSPDKSISMIGFGFNNLSKLMSVPFNIYYQEARFKSEIQNVRYPNTDNKTVLDNLRKFVDELKSISKIQNHNRIQFDEFDFLFSIEYKDDRNEYTLSSDEANLTITSYTLDSLLVGLRDYLYTLIEIPEPEEVIDESIEDEETTENKENKDSEDSDSYEDELMESDYVEDYDDNWDEDYFKSSESDYGDLDDWDNY